MQRRKMTAKEFRQSQIWTVREVVAALALAVLAWFSGWHFTAWFLLCFAMVSLELHSDRVTHGAMDFRKGQDDGE